MSDCGVLLSGREVLEEEILELTLGPLRLPLVTDVKDHPLTLVECGTNWGLVSREFPKMKPIVVDFSDSKWQRRQKKIGGSGDILSKALKKVVGKKAIDATAGWGRDSLHLLSLGFEVTSLEINLLLFTLLKFGHKRALPRDDSKTIYSRLRIIHADSISYLESLQTEEQRPDLVFLDPMFPLREKSALSCKEMQILQFLSQPSPERDIHILKSAQHVVRDRVIVKRPLNSPPLLEGARHTYKGKSVRYDVYFPES